MGNGSAGCATFEGLLIIHTQDLILYMLSNSNGDAVSYVIPVQLDTQKRYKISAYVKARFLHNARAKMKIGSTWEEMKIMNQNSRSNSPQRLDIC